VRKIIISGSGGRFTRPESKADPRTYPVPTPTAITGILESIYWKPEFWWRIKSIEVLNPIRIVPVMYNHLNTESACSVDHGGTRLQRRCTELRNVAYRVQAEVVAPNDNPDKHLAIFADRVNKGAHFRQPYMGACEHFAEVEWDDGRSPVIPIDQNFGWMPLAFTPKYDAASRYKAVSWVPDTSG
jgi:CRISPR-associated protein Cas5d